MLVQTIYSAVVAVLILPSLVAAQVSIGGTVKDDGGQALPGVTVEASSPALIEESRQVTTDAQGRYRFVGLRPGTYTIAFSLGGFTTVRREGIELDAAAQPPLNAFLKAGPAGGWSFHVPPPFTFLFDGYDRNDDQRSAQAKWAGLPCEKIVLERSGCLVPCRRYRVSFSRRTQQADRGLDAWWGRAELHATVPPGTIESREWRPFPERQGEFEGRINLYTYGRLCHLITSARFLELEDSYAANATDLGTVTTTVIVDGRANSVAHYGYVGPTSLWGIEQAIEGVAQSLAWERK